MVQAMLIVKTPLSDEWQGLGKHHFLTERMSARDAGVMLQFTEAEPVFFGEAIKRQPADVMARVFVAGAGISKPHDQVQFCHVNPRKKIQSL